MGEVVCLTAKEYDEHLELYYNEIEAAVTKVGAIDDDSEEDEGDAVVSDAFVVNVVLSVRDSMKIKIKPTTTILQLVHRICEMRKLDTNTHRVNLTFDGDSMDDLHRVASDFGLENGDMIEAAVVERGVEPLPVNLQEGKTKQALSKIQASQGSVNNASAPVASLSQDSAAASVPKGPVFRIIIVAKESRQHFNLRVEARTPIATIYKAFHSFLKLDRTQNIRISLRDVVLRPSGRSVGDYHITDGDELDGVVT